MRPLNKRAVAKIKSVLREGTQGCVPFAVDCGAAVIVTNTSWLMEWPKELIDAEAIYPLICNADNTKKTKSTAKRLLKQHWSEIIIPDMNFVPVDEVDASDDHIDTVVMQYYGSAVRYDWTNIELTEYFLPDAEYQMYLPVDETTTLKPLCIFDGELLMGTFTNSV